MKRRALGLKDRLPYDFVVLWPLSVLSAVLASCILLILEDEPALAAITTGAIVVAWLVLSLVVMGFLRIRGRMAYAYIGINVKAPSSPEVARLLSQRPGVAYTAAVWGQWDVVALVGFAVERDLLRTLSAIQATNNVVSTETLLVRSDQYFDRELAEAVAGGKLLAFIFLKMDSQKTRSAYERIEALAATGLASIYNVAGVFGSYDIAATLLYSNEAELKTLVMETIQEQTDGVDDTLTLLAVLGEVYKVGNAFPA